MSRSRARNIASLIADLLDSAGRVKASRSNAVNTSYLVNNAVTSTKLADASVTGNKIADDSVTGNKIATDAVGSSEIADNSVSASELNVSGNGTQGQYLGSDADGSFTWTDISSDPSMGGDLSGTASNAQLKANVVGSSELADNSVHSNHLVTNSVGNSEIVNGAVGNSKLASNSVANAQIADNAITANKMAANSVGESELTANAVTVGKILNGSVTSAKIANNSISQGHMLDNSIGAAELNVSGNGNTSQYLGSDGDGSMTWKTINVSNAGKVVNVHHWYDQGHHGFNNGGGYFMDRRWTPQSQNNIFVITATIGFGADDNVGGFLQAFYNGGHHNMGQWKGSGASRDDANNTSWGDLALRHESGMPTTRSITVRWQPNTGGQIGVRYRIRPENGTRYANRRNGWGNDSNNGLTAISTLTVMEIEV